MYSQYGTADGLRPAGPHHGKVDHCVAGESAQRSLVGHQVNQHAQPVDDGGQPARSVCSHEELLQLVLQSLPLGGCRLVHVRVFPHQGLVPLVGVAGYVQLLLQRLHVLRQQAEHDARSCALLIKGLHHFLHRHAAPQHVLHGIGGIVHALLGSHVEALHRVVQLAEDGHHLLHARLPLQFALGQSDSLGHLEGVVLDGRNHTAQRRGRHLHATAQGIHRGTQRGYLVNRDARLSTHGTHAAHEVGDRSGGGSRVGTQGDDGRTHALQRFPIVVAVLLQVARGVGNLHQCAGRLVTHLGQGHGQHVGSLGKALNILRTLQTDRTCHRGQIHQVYQRTARVHLRQFRG